MQEISVAHGLVSIEEFVENTERILADLACSGPVVLLEDGKPAGVLLSPQEFDALREEIRFRDKVAESLMDERPDIPHERVREWLLSVGTPNEIPPPQ
jgi:PHD/YefM family antitoxin component YafN of YafNO toxin-antitoxin module